MRSFGLLTAGEIPVSGSKTSERAAAACAVSMVLDTGWGAIVQTMPAAETLTGTNGVSNRWRAGA